MMAGQHRKLVNVPVLNPVVVNQPRSRRNICNYYELRLFHLQSKLYSYINGAVQVDSIGEKCIHICTHQSPEEDIYLSTLI